MEENYFSDEKNDQKILRTVAEQAISLTDICPQYDEDVVGATNVFCVFHENFNTPSAKLYLDEERDIVVLHCFAEHKTYTSYDYIKLILVEKKHAFKSVKDFLIYSLGKQTFNEYYELAEQSTLLANQNLMEQTIDYINNTSSEADDTLDFINRLYSAN